ncbi:hypothetical protein DFH28DRAFT_1127072 [Melampsora americana]|nr:hypothetical protein DFH28DRAFT_1127072 [Melampsora americana]
MKITINKRKKKNQKKENLKENFSLIPSRPSSTSSDITTSTSIRIRGQPISLPLSNPIQQEPQEEEEEEAELHIRSTNPTQPIQSRLPNNGSREEEEEEQSKSEEEQSKSSNSSIYSNEEQTNLNYNHHQISNQTQKSTITLPLSPKKPLRQSQTTLKGQKIKLEHHDQAPIPSCSSSTSDSNSHSNQSNSDDHNNEKKNHQQLSESKSDDLEIYIQKVLDRIRTSTTIKHQKQQPLPPPPPSSSSSSSSYRTQPKTNHHHHHHHPLESRIKSNQIQFNPHSNELTNLTHKKQQHRFSISSSSSSNKLKKSKSNRSSYIHQSTTLPNESKSQNVPFLATSHPHELNHTNLESNLNHYQLNNHPTAPNHQNQKMNLTTHQFHHQPNSLNLNLNQSSNSHPLQNHLNHTLTSISKPDDQHLLIPSHPIDQLSPSPSTSTSDHELASLYAKYQSSSHTTATDSMSSSQSSSSSSSGNNSNAHLHQSSSIPLPSPLAQTVDSDSLENTIHQSPSINGIHDSNQSEPINAHQSQSINGIHDQAIRLDSESFQSSTSLQTQAKVFDELNLMLGEAIDSAHSDFNHLHITTKSPFAQFDPNQTKQEDLPASTSYSSLLSSVKRKINATKLERQSDRRRSFSPQKLSLQTALSSLDESTADLTIVSSTSSLSQYSEENPYKDDHYPEEEEEEEKVEKSDRLTPLPISKTLSNDESDSSSIHLDQTSSSSTSVTHDSNQPDQQSLSTKVRMTSPTKPQSKIPSSPSSFQPQSPSTPIPINSYPQLISTHGSISRPIDTTPTKSSNPSTTHPTTHHHQTSPINRHINQSSPNLGHIKPRKSLLMSRSSSESSQLNQWQWLESHPSSELRGPTWTTSFLSIR